MARVFQHRITPTLTALAYASGDQMGSAEAIPFATLQTKDRVVELTSLSIVDSAGLGGLIRVHFYSEDPSLLSSDGAAFDLTDREVWQCYFDVANEDWSDTLLNGNPAKIASFHDLELHLFSTALNELKNRSDILYVVVEAREALTFTSTTDLTFIYNLED